MTKQFLIYRVLRPLVQRLPMRVWVVGVELAALGIGTWRAWSQRNFVSAVLQACGRSCNFQARRAFTSRHVYHQLRRLDYYLHDGCKHVEIDWSGQPPGAGRVCLVPMDTYGVEQIDALLREHPSWMIRRRFDGELDASNPSTTSRPWADHCARLRAQMNPDHTIDIQTESIKLRAALLSPLHLLAFQGHMKAAEGANNDRPFMGATVSMQLGAVRLAQKAHAPLRFVRIVPRSSHWTIVIEPAIPADEAALSSRMQQALMDDPACWTLWPDFLRARQTSVPQHPNHSASHWETTLTAKARQEQVGRP